MVFKLLISPCSFRFSYFPLHGICSAISAIVCVHSKIELSTGILLELRINDVLSIINAIADMSPFNVIQVFN